MSLQVIKGGQKDDPYERLVDALREVIVQIVEEHERERPRQPLWRWLTTKQASELLGISPHRVAARVRQGTLPGRTYQGRTYVDREELEKTIGRRKIR